MPIPGTTTGLSIITQAMRELGALDLYRVPNGNEGDYGKQKLNQVVGQWALQNRLLLGNRIDQLTFPSSQQSYTIGPAGELDTDSIGSVRPMIIDFASIAITTGSSTVYLPVTPLQTKEWLGIPVPGFSSTIPIRMYYDQNCDPITGLGRIYFNPYPGAPLPDFLWMTRQRISEFTDLNAAYVLGPGVEGALVFSVAETMTALSPPAENLARCISQAAIMRANLSSKNTAPPRITTDFGLGSQQQPTDYFNWLTGNIT